jgi:HK97 family phage portal protein
VPQQKRVSTLSPADSGNWMTIYRGGYDNGWWQKDIHYTARDADRNTTVFACMTLIAGDISKLAVMLVEKVKGVWQETDSPAYRTFLRKPNGFQTLQQFLEYWQLSKQSHGNAYILLERDGSTRVRAAYVLDPERVAPLIAPNGDVFYELKADDLAGVPDDEGVIRVPASEMMHDRMNCLFHPLVGLSPLWAANLPALQGLTIQEKSRSFFANNSQPGGLLTTPTPLTDAQAKQYRQMWKDTYGEGGANAGGTAVLGNGLSYSPMGMSAVDAELVKQWDMTAFQICSAFHVPAYKVGVGPTPAYQSAEVLNQIYYDSCLQKQIEAHESMLDQGLELHNVDGRVLRAQFDIDGLLRMDNRTLISAMAEGVKAGIMSPDEGRARINLPPVPGGDSPYLQQQNFSLAALAKRDAQQDPVAPNAPAPSMSGPPPAANDENAGEDAAAAAKELADHFMKGLEYATA